MKKSILVFALVLLISAGIAIAADLSTYPTMFFAGDSFNAQIIVGSSSPATDTLAASDIAVALQQISASQVTAGLESDYVSSKNAILIGLPCQNPVLATVLETTACDFGLSDGQGYIKLIEKDGRTNLIVTGKTAADTRKAARVLANYKQFGLMGTEVIVTGTLDAPLVQRLQEPLQIKSSTISSCKTDADCPDDKWCLAETCTDLGCPEGTVAKNHDCIKDVKTETKPAAAAANETPKTAEPTVVEPPKAEEKGFFAKIIGWFRSLFGRK